MSAGSWVENDARWFELRMVYCELCGRVIAKRGWQVVVDGGPRLFCNPECEHLYRSYVLRLTLPPAPAART